MHITYARDVSYEKKLLKIKILFYSFNNGITRLQMTYSIPPNRFKFSGKIKCN